MDARASELVTRWLADGTVGAAYAHTGSGMFPGCHGPLLHWLQEHEPEALDRAAVAGYCVDAVAQHLTGRVCLDASDATLPFLDPRTRRYAPEALAACGVEGRAELLSASRRSRDGARAGRAGAPGCWGCRRGCPSWRGRTTC